MRLYQYLILLLGVPYPSIASLSIHSYEGQKDFLVECLDKNLVFPVYPNKSLPLLACAKINSRVIRNCGLTSEIYKTKILKKDDNQIGFITYVFRSTGFCGIQLGSHAYIVALALACPDTDDLYKNSLISEAINDSYFKGFVKTISVFIPRDNSDVKEIFTNQNFKKDFLAQSGEDEKYVLSLVKKES
jgi:hypothetical protein